MMRWRAGKHLNLCMYGMAACVAIYMLYVEADIHAYDIWGEIQPVAQPPLAFTSYLMTPAGKAQQSHIQ